MAGPEKVELEKLQGSVARLVSESEIEEIVQAFNTFLKAFQRVKADNDEHRRVMSAEAKALSKQLTDKVEKTLRELVAKITAIQKGTDGYTPLKGVDYPSESQIRDMMESMRPETPIEGVHFHVPRLEDIVRKALTMLRPASFAKMLFDTPNNVITAINGGSNQINAERVEGLTELIKDIKKKTVTTFFAGAPGEAANLIKPWRTPPEIPNGSITAFTVGVSAPTDVIVDGIAMYQGAGYTFASSQITLTNPAAQYVRFR